MTNIIEQEDIFSDTPIDWEDLFYDLKNERAVLVLGPEFHSRDGVSIKMQLYNELIQRPDHGILHFYSENGIFLFKSPGYKSKAQKFASQFYKALNPNDEIVRKIMELPFSLIINTNPDRAIEKVYKEKGIECQFDYFTSKPQKKEKELAPPDIYYRLIYNLFGSVEFHESIVLDFEDLFEHLRTLLNNVNVPPVLRDALLLIDTYIFIGFHVEKWDTQLLFRYLNMKEHSFDDKKKNYTTKMLNIDNNSESFFRQQFNLKYFGVPIEFLNDMHKKYFETIVQEENKIDNELPFRKRIESFIAEDEIEKALNILTVYIKDTDECVQDLILVKSNFSRYMHLKIKNLENREFLEILRNKIKQSILDITKIYLE